MLFMSIETQEKKAEKKTEINVTQHIYITFDAITTGSY